MNSTGMLSRVSFWGQLGGNFYTDIATLPQLEYDDGRPLATLWAIGYAGLSSLQFL